MSFEKAIPSQHLFISMLIPPNFKAFFDELEREVETICGARHSRAGEVSRYGFQPGCIVMGN
jgi:hypothetical protein